MLPGVNPNQEDPPMGAMLETLQGYKSYLVVGAALIAWLLGSQLGLITAETEQKALEICVILFGATFAAKVNRIRQALGESGAPLVAVLAAAGFAASMLLAPAAIAADGSVAAPPGLLAVYVIGCIASALVGCFVGWNAARLRRV
jgi:hypothetical protein